MSEAKTVLILCPRADFADVGESMRESFESMGVKVESMVIEENYAQVLDKLEQDVVPVVLK